MSEKKKRVNICLSAHLIFHLPSANPIIFTRIEPLVFKFSISVFYTSILQGTTLSLPPILFMLQICEHCEGRSFMSNPPQSQRIIKGDLQFITRLTLSLSLSLAFFFFFFKILVQNLFGIKILRVFLILLEGVPIFFFKGKQIKKIKLLYISS